MTLLSDLWEQEAEHWVKWAREPGHDSYWQFHRDQFLQLLPAPGALTVDVGCGEGRLPRDLKARGHSVVGVDVSPTLIKHAQQADPSGDYRVGNAAALPVEDGCCDLVVAFMSLHDVDELDKAMHEINRVLRGGGTLCMAIVHPLNSAGLFADESPDSSFVISGSYLAESQYAYPIERDGFEMTFHSKHRPLEAFSRALESAGLLIEAIREHAVPAQAAHEPRMQRWQRVPLFLHLRGLKPRT